VLAAYEADRAHARTAEGSPTEFQERAARRDGVVRYTAPSLVFHAGGDRLAEPDLAGAEAGLVSATGEGRVVRRPVGDGSLWSRA